MSCGKFSKLTSTRWLTGDAEVLLDGADRQRRAADRVGRVDLVLAVAGDVDDGVARDRERRVVAAADAHQQDRVRARGLADLVRAGLLGALRAGVGAEHEDRVRARSACSRAPPSSASGGVGDLRRLDLRGDQEQHERDQQPGDERRRRSQRRTRQTLIAPAGPARRDGAGGGAWRRRRRSSRAAELLAACRAARRRRAAPPQEASACAR